jgi:HTH-type transcriptional regulator, competence development regulator
MDKRNEAFGKTLRELRRSAGVSQRELASRVGVDFSYISKVENGRIPPPAADTIVRICEVLGVDPDQLLAATGKMPTQIKEMLGGSSSALRFMREAYRMALTDDEWTEMVEQMKRLRGEHDQRPG